MYETEANLKSESASQIPSEVLSALGETKGKVASRTLISWGEHCTECGWPTCYTTCELYEPREDLKCRRFVDGMVRVDCAESLTNYLLKISFKRWGMLWARGNFQLHPLASADRMERRDYRIGTVLQQLPFSAGARRQFVEKRYSFKKRLASRGAPDGDRPTSFLLECYNPQSETIRLSLRIRTLHSSHPFPNLVQLAPGFRRARELQEAQVAFETMIAVAPGFLRTKIPFSLIAPFVDMRAPFRIDITPNDVEHGDTLYFGAMDFIHETEASAESGKTVKCVVWDLDNTLWDGILVEDGLDKLRIKPGIVDVIKELDRRGILQSVVSKNSPDEALEAIKFFGLEPYFLYPQISWQPKSGGIKALAQALNIGLDSLLFVDDSEFELMEVQAVCPEVRVLNSRFYLTLPESEQCQVPITDESASRRKMYQVEAARNIEAQSFGQDYMAFLRHSQIKMEIAPLTDDNLERVYELTQRTNQMNFSGNRYSREVLKTIQSTPHLDTYVLACEDRFGSYGVVGFSIVDRREPRMTDLMFSCRVQSKRVEHAFLTFVIQKYTAERDRDFFANYRRTSRNAPAGRVFDDIGMKEIADEQGVSVLLFPLGQALTEEGIVEIKVTGEMTAARTS